jgi:quinol monooxygenase YgiN
MEGNAFMLIIAGYLEVDASRRDDYVAAHHDLLRRGREAVGCIDLAISADPLNPTRVNNFERWESREHLEAWRKVAAVPNHGISITGGQMMEYTIAEARPPFG